MFHIRDLPALRAAAGSLEVPSQDPAEWAYYEAARADWFAAGSQPRAARCESALGATMLTQDGQDLIDVSGQTLNCVLGLNDPWVKLRQVQFLLSPHPHFVTIRIGFDLYHRYADRVLQRLHQECGGARRYRINHRSCNGGDAVELAIQAAAKAAATRYPSRQRFGTFRGSYHGQNLTCALVSEHQDASFLVAKPLPSIDFFEVPSERESSWSTTLDAIDRDDCQYAAVLIEPIQVRNAVTVIPAEFLRKLCEVCRRREVCLIFDEIQSGFGYCGALTYASSIGAFPDAFAFSKGVTSGHGALGLTILDEPYATCVDSTFCGKTNAGDVLAMVAADAVMDRLFGIPQDEMSTPRYRSACEAFAESAGFQRGDLCSGLLVTTYPAVEAALLRMIQGLISDFPTLLSSVVPGFGLLRGVTILGADGNPSTPLCAWVCAESLKHGVYVRQAEHTIILKPCVTITMDELRAAGERLRSTFHAALRHRDDSTSTSLP